ncbi:MAG: lactate utilization protein B, partial [Acidimicrobiales bacterium]
MPRSEALRDRRRLVPTRPEWAGSGVVTPPGPLAPITAEALEQPALAGTSARLSSLNRRWIAPGWSSPWAELRERGAAIRRETLADLDGHLAALTAQVEANGGVVHRVATPAQAVAVIERIARDNDAHLVVKSKSMATEELHLNHALEQGGMEVVETDLGEYIVQLADERPSHIIAPAVHRSRSDVADLFEQLEGAPLGREPTDLAAFARHRLRQDFRRADMGITGVNFAAADTGTISIVTNEGNAGMVTSQPRVHVAVMPIEKVVPRFADLAVLLPLVSFAGTRTTLSVYQTLVTGPRRPGEVDGPEQLHLVIFDNGRSRVLGTRYEEVLACIRCGACQIACPVYRTVGGHAYASIYGGPIGAVLTPLIGDRRDGDELPFLSSLCGACADACPVKIPLPDMLVDLRADYEAAHREPAERLGHWGWRAWSELWSRRAGLAASRAVVGAAGRHLPPALLQRLPGPGRGWAAGRTLPPLGQAGRLRSWMAAHVPGPDLRQPEEGPIGEPEPAPAPAPAAPTVGAPARAGAEVPTA